MKRLLAVLIALSPVSCSRGFAGPWLGYMTGVDDVYGVSLNTDLTVSAANGVLRNDVASTSARAELIDPPPVGTFALAPDGSFSFSPPHDFFGPAAFRYRVHDGPHRSASTTATIQVFRKVELVPDPPALVISQGTSHLHVCVNALDGFSDPTPVSIVLSGMPGLASFNHSAPAYVGGCALFAFDGTDVTPTPFVAATMTALFGSPPAASISETLFARVGGRSGEGDDIAAGGIDAGSTNDDAFALAVQPDLKMLVGGVSTSSFVLRLQLDGALDPTFGTDGISTFQGSGVKGVSALPDGKILVASVDSTGALLQRLNADGTVDPTFTAAPVDVGQTFGVPGATVSLGGMAVTADGSVYEAGTFGTSPAASRAFVGKFDPATGDVDPTWGQNSGLTEIAWSTTTANIATAIVVDDTGRVIVGGSGGSEFALARLDANGFLDPTFNGSGLFTGTSGPTAAINAITLGADGSVYAAGTSTAAGIYPFLLVGLDPTGTPIPAFGPSGMALDGAADGARAIIRDPDSRFIAFGQSAYVTAYRFAADGSGDPQFDTSGNGYQPRIVSLGVLQGAYHVGAAAIAPDGRYLVTGHLTRSDSTSDVFVAGVFP